MRSAACSTALESALAAARSCSSSAARPARWRRSGRAASPSRERSARGSKLSVPVLPWHAHRDRLAGLACALGVATGTLGKIARDLALLAQTEVAEAHERPADAGGSSTMPHKRNPVRAAVALAAAVRAPGLVATMLSAMPQEHERGLGGWQAEWDALPELVGVDRRRGARRRGSARGTGRRRGAHAREPRHHPRPGAGGSRGHAARPAARQAGSARAASKPRPAAWSRRDARWPTSSRTIPRSPRCSIAAPSTPRSRRSTTWDARARSSRTRSADAATRSGSRSSVSASGADRDVAAG